MVMLVKNAKLVLFLTAIAVQIITEQSAQAANKVLLYNRIFAQAAQLDVKDVNRLVFV